MPVIKVNNVQYSLHRGPNRLGSGAEADVQVEGGALGVQAIVELADDDQAVIRRASPTADVRVNGITLVDPTPLMHGDKVEISGTELLFADDTKTGNTSFVNAAEVAAIAQKRTGPARPTSATGGRLVSLVDGKEYIVPPTGITIGRDAGSGIVVAQNDVSRRHAEIVPVDNGYELRDFSVNGVYVNGARVVKMQLLARADIIRVGTEEFRFYADVRPGPAPPVAVPSLAVTMMGMPAATRAAASGAPPAAPPAAAPRSSPPATRPAIAPAFVAQAPTASPPPPPPPAPPAPPAAPRVASPPVASAPADPAPVFPELPPSAPIPVRADPRPVLATLEVVNAGPSKGQTFTIHAPLAHVGRGGHNDVVLTDDSVSETHAKLQRRDDGWYVVDVGSTNGTYVGGQRLSGERKLEGAPDVRFGGVKMIFRAKDAGNEGTIGSTRAIASIDRSKLRSAAGSAPDVAAPVAATAPERSAASRGLPVWVWIVVVLAIGAAGAFFLLNR